MSWHEVCQFLDQSDPNDGLGTHKREKMPLDDLLLEGSSNIKSLGSVYAYEINYTKGGKTFWRVPNRINTNRS